MPEPKQDALSVIAGTDLEETYDIWDSLTGEFVDWTVGTWQAEMEVYDRAGQLLARLATHGTRDGQIHLLSGGRLRLYLGAAFTATLPLTRPYENSTDPRIAGWRHRGVHSFVLTATETVSGDVSGLAEGSLTVHQPGT